MIRQTFQRYAPALIGALAGCVVVGLIVVIGQIGQVTAATRSTQLSNTQITRNNAETLRLIKSCTTPGQPCYDRGQAATADAVGQINRVVILAAACASAHPGQSPAQVQACVVRGLAKGSKK